MRVGAAPDDVPVYRALWAVGGRPMLVVLRQHPADLFGAVWIVHAYASDGRLWKTGAFSCQQDDRPVGLVEAKSSSARFEAPYRGRWILAVALLDGKDAETARRHLPYAFPGDGRADEDPAAVRVLRVEPVRWDGPGDEGVGGFAVGVLDDSDAPASFRGAEAGVPEAGGTRALPFRAPAK